MISPPSGGCNFGPLSIFTSSHTLVNLGDSRNLVSDLNRKLNISSEEE